MSTLTVPPNLMSPRQDATDLYKAFKGFGCDSAVVVNILAHRDAAQRSLIQQEYRAMYSEELTGRLSKELSGDLKKAMLLWGLDPATRDATLVRQALTGGDVDMYAATEILCSRTPSQIQTMKQMYLARFGSHLEHDIHYQALGDHDKLLHKSMKGLGTKDTMIIRIVVSRTEIDMQYIKAEYQKKYKKALGAAIHSETSGHYSAFLLALVGH